MDRFDRRGTPMEEDEEVVEENSQLNVMELELGRPAEPESTDGQVSYVQGAVQSSKELF